MREITWLEICPRVSVWSHILDTQVLGSDKGKTNTLRWFQGYVANKRSVGSSDCPSRSMCSGAYSQATMKRRDSDRICGYLFSQQLPTLTHALLSVCPICTGAGAAMTRQKAEKWETEVHLTQGGMWVEQPGSCSWRALT